MFEPNVDDFTFAAHVNNTAVFYTAVAFLDLLDAGNKQRNLPQDSQIIVTSSIAGFSRQLASSFAYSSSKAAVTHLVKMLATYFAQAGYHIRANVIAPGLYPSEMTQGTTSNLEAYSGKDGHETAFAGAHVVPAENSPAQRTGSEEDFAGTVLYMASRAGAFLNGETLVTDGGRLSQMPSVY
jgi:NAD(P)-dependent dehydrogenase (short-subunit alcohol dehydrogenase family)